jgi:hypothetical protein
LNAGTVSSQYAAVSNYAGLSSAANAVQFSIEMLVKVSRLPTAEIDFFTYGNSQTANAVGLGGDSGGFLYMTFRGVTLDIPVRTEVIADGYEHRISLTWDGRPSGGYIIYMDGVAIYSGTHPNQTSSLNAGGTLVFGQEQDTVGGGFQSSQILPGTIADIRIFNDVRTPEEIAANAFIALPDPLTTQGLVNNWQVSAATTTSITDAHGGEALALFGAPPVSLFGNWDDDLLHGGIGNDILDGGAGSDTLDGGAGDDRIIYDAADVAANVVGGADSDTLVVVGGNLPTGFDLVASAFEQAEWQQTDNTGQSWSTIVGRYNSNWQITSSSTILDSGVDREMLYDYTSPISWQSRQLDYAAPADGWALTYDYLIFDDLSSRDTSYDTDLATAYRSIRNDYDATGLRTYLYFVFEDKTGRDTTLDYTTDIVWQSQRNDYDAMGFKTYNYLVFDDGTSRDTSLDNTANVAWQSLRQDYDVNGHMNYQYYVFDDNTSRQVVIDATDQFSWNTQVTNYNAAGQAVEFFVT